MARPPALQTVDFFPHMTKQKKTIFILKRRFGNDGYSFWYQILEYLASTEGHTIDTTEPDTWEYIQALTLCDEARCNEILDLLAKLEAIDKDLWNQDRVIWSQNLVDNLRHLYSKRKSGIPQKPDFRAGNPPSPPVSAPEMPQRRGEERKERKEREPRAREADEVQNPETQVDPPDDHPPEPECLTDHAWQEFKHLMPLRGGKFLDEDACREKWACEPARWPQWIRAVNNYRESREVSAGAVCSPMTFLSRKWLDWLEPEQPLGGCRDGPMERLIAKAKSGVSSMPKLEPDEEKLFREKNIPWPRLVQMAAAGELT